MNNIFVQTLLIVLGIILFVATLPLSLLAVPVFIVLSLFRLGQYIMKEPDTKGGAK